jgi:hypothetical protein
MPVNRQLKGSSSSKIYAPIHAGTPVLPVIVTGLFALAGCAGTWAAEPPGSDDFNPGLHGSISAFLGIKHFSPSQVMVGDDNERIDSLDDTADAENEFTPFGFGELSYTLDNRRTQFYLTKADLPLELGEALLAVGAKQRLGDDTVLGLALVPRLEGIDSETWEDPFLTDEEREETDVTSEGAVLSAKKPFGLPFSIRYAFAKQRIDTERSGEALLGQSGSTLTEADAERLERDATFHKVSIDSFIPLSPSVYLLPGVHYTRGNAEGDAYDFDSAGVRLGLMYLYKQYDFSVGLAYAAYDYGERHPVFKKTRDDERFAANLRVGYKQPFGWDSTRMDYLLGYRQRNSNIAFYESEELSAGVSLSYGF